MNYTKEQNKEFAIKLMIFEAEICLGNIRAVIRGDYTNKEIIKIIKKYENK